MSVSCSTVVGKDWTLDTPCPDCGKQDLVDTDPDSYWRCVACGNTFDVVDEDGQTVADHSNPNYVAGCVAAQVEDLSDADALRVLREATTEIEARIAAKGNPVTPEILNRLRAIGEEPANGWIGNHSDEVCAELYKRGLVFEDPDESEYMRLTQQGRELLGDPR